LLHGIYPDKGVPGGSMS